MPDEEVFDVQERSQPAPESSAETKAPEPKETTETPGDAPEQSSQPEEQPKAEKQESRSTKRIRELTAKNRELMEMLSAQQTSNAPQKTANPDVDDDAQNLVELVRRGVSDAPEIQELRQTLYRQAAERQLEKARAQFPDFDEYLPDVHEVLKGDPRLRGDDAVQRAYFMAKGMRASELADSARDAGRQEAYSTMTQKAQAGVTPTAPKPSGDAGDDLLARHRAGKLSPEERRANWPKIIAAMAEANE